MSHLTWTRNPNGEYVAEEHDLIIIGSHPDPKHRDGWYLFRLDPDRTPGEYPTIGDGSIADAQHLTTIKDIAREYVGPIPVELNAVEPGDIFEHAGRRYCMEPTTVFDSVSCWVEGMMSRTLHHVRQVSDYDDPGTSRLVAFPADGRVNLIEKGPSL